MRIKQIREQLGIKQKDFAASIGMAANTLSQYETGKRQPDLETLKLIASGLGVSIDELLEVEMKKAPAETRVNRVAQVSPPKPLYSSEAQKVAASYDKLDSHGKTAVQVILAEEQKRVEAEEARRREKELWLDDPDEAGEQSDPRVIPLYYTPAAAGFASPAFGEDFEYIQVGGEVPRHADFAVRIDGDSMEPYILDGATVYVNRDPLANGDVGIFFVDGDMLCKQYYKDEHGRVHLLSLNRDRADADRVLPPGGGITLTCYGRVILPQQPRIAIL